MNYPHSLDDSNSLFQVKDLGRSALFSEIDATQLEVMIENPTNFPEGRHIVVTDSEMMIVSHRIDNVLHIEKRGAFDTFPDVHTRASKVGVVFASAHYETLRDATIEIQKELWTYRKPVIDIINDPQTIIPAENDSYLVDTNPINEFVGKANNIATWNGIEWTFIAPQIGFETYVVNKGKYEFNGSNWILNKDIEISNVNNLQDDLDKKVDKVEGKSLVEDTKVTSYDNHLINENNPHNVTASQLNVYTKIESDNLLNKKANLDVNNKIPLSEIPDSVLGQLEYMGTHNFNTMPTATEKGQYWICSVAGNGYNVGDWAVYNGTGFDKVDNTDAVSSVAGKTGNVVLNKNDVGLNNVDNTSDLNKPISTATQTALNTKVSKVTSTDNAIVRFNGTTGEVQNSIISLDDAGRFSKNGNFVLYNNNLNPSSTSGETLLHLTYDGSNGSAISSEKITNNVTNLVLYTSYGYGNLTPMARLDHLGHFTLTRSGGKFVGDLNGNSATVTNGVYTVGNQTIDGIKTFTTGLKLGSGMSGTTTKYLNNMNGKQFSINPGHNGSYGIVKLDLTYINGGSAVSKLITEIDVYTQGTNNLYKRFDIFSSISPEAPLTVTVSGGGANRAPVIITINSGALWHGGYAKIEFAGAGITEVN